MAPTPAPTPSPTMCPTSPPHVDFTNFTISGSGTNLKHDFKPDYLVSIPLGTVAGSYLIIYSVTLTLGDSCGAYTYPTVTMAGAAGEVPNWF